VSELVNDGGLLAYFVRVIAKLSTEVYGRLSPDYESDGITIPSAALRIARRLAFCADGLRHPAFQALQTRHDVDLPHAVVGISRRDIEVAVESARHLTNEAARSRDEICFEVDPSAMESIKRNASALDER